MCKVDMLDDIKDHRLYFVWDCYIVFTCLFLNKSPQNWSISLLHSLFPSTTPQSKILAKEPQKLAVFNLLIHCRTILTINFSQIDYPMLLI